ncbi:MAG: chemotaxis protein CheX, partial [Propionibacteriaceae bacterium]|nr:chemotaxis protein CheX [Propionibacteriaceae bacterium]
MSSQQNEQLSVVFCDIVEKLTFMFPEPATAAELPGGFAGYVRVAMDFSGDASGTIVLAVPAEMCAELAANLLGMDPEDEEVQLRARDALQELLNVFTGHALTTLHGDASTCDLTVPVSADMDAE